MTHDAFPATKREDFDAAHGEPANGHDDIFLNLKFDLAINLSVQSHLMIEKQDHAVLKRLVRAERALRAALTAVEEQEPSQ